MNQADNKILVFIPAYRCATQLKRVLNQFSVEVQMMVDAVLVVDNRSPDETLDEAVATGKKVFTHCGFIAWRNDDNYGLGGSHKAAMRYATEQGFTHLIVLHGDDQADIRDLLPYLTAGTYTEYDCFLGARFMAGSRLMGYSFFRTFGNHVYNALFSVVVATSVKDLGSGLNMYRLEALREYYYKTFPDDLTFNYLMLLASYNRSQSVKFFPITWREEDQVSNVKIFRQAFRVLYLLLGYAFGRNKFLSKDVRKKPFSEYTGVIVHQQNNNEKSKAAARDTNEATH